jgi:dTDP-4-amino-4,6-dideoxygalactose transaminase
MFQNKNESWPNYSYREIDIVKNVLKSNKVNYWTGEQCKLFEDEFSKYIGVKYSTAVANGSVGLNLAVAAMNLEKGSEVIVTPRSYITSVTCVINNGLKPVFADVDFWSQNLSAEHIKKKITSRTKAVILVHLAGMPCDMFPILELTKKLNIKIIEDCSQAHGAVYNNKIVGSMGDISVWSFCNDKIISTCGEGGMVSTNNNKFFKRIWAGKDCGRNINKIKKKNSKVGFKWIHDFAGTNLRMTELQAAVGRYQIKKLDSWIKIRNRNAKKIYNICKKYDFIDYREIPSHIKHAYYRCYIFINLRKLKKSWNRDKIITFLLKKNVKCNSGSCPEIYLEKSIKRKKYGPKKRLPNAKLLGKATIAFEVHNKISKKSMVHICSSIKSVFDQAGKGNRQ